MKRIILSSLFSAVVFCAASVVPVYAGYVITTIAGKGTTGYSGDGGKATSAQLAAPSRVAVDASGNVYIADSSNQVIRKVNTAGIISTFAGNGYGAGTSGGGYSGDGGPATSAKLNNPVSVAVDASGNVYIGDMSNQRIRKVNTSGIISTIAGDGVTNYSGDGGPATAAELCAPEGVAVDSSGNIYIADTGNVRVRKINISGIISTIAGGGSGLGDGGPATSAEVNPAGIAIDASGNIYIAGNSGWRIRKINTSGVISTIAGNGVQGFSGDGGPATSAELNGQGGVAVDALGNVYITENGNYRVRKVDSSGIISTFAGNGVMGYSGDGGGPTLAELNYPEGVAIDASGNVYIADSSNQAIRKIFLAPDVNNSGSGPVKNAFCYPSPVRFSAGEKLYFANFSPDSKVYIISTAGQALKEMKTDANGAVAPWDGITDNGEHMASGVYLVHGKDEKGSNKIFEIMVLK